MYEGDCRLRSVVHPRVALCQRRATETTDQTVELAEGSTYTMAYQYAVT